MKFSNILRSSLVLLFGLAFMPRLLLAQQAYFVDGFHGGIWGHYPKGYTSFMMDQLAAHPGWKINLEIEPETWDDISVSDPESYLKFQNLFKDQSVNGRIEYVNPAYGQSYLFNISGESIVRQFEYGMEKIKSHFPEATFTTYSSEEPCFTSALPQLLKSFGFKYASLKNPNTCWGGYTRAFGGELVNWTGPDGTGILAVPRYEMEQLKPGSTWETIANGNSKGYVTAAFDAGIKNPVGMCFQDAGWRYGPWLKGEYYQPSVYTTWRNYFENVADKSKAKLWKFGQEDVLVSLVWGAQVLQKLTQEVRTAENKIVQAEKIAAMSSLENGAAYPADAFHQAWAPLLLSQHHDCWIVPYNGPKGNNWADKVKKWTTFSNAKSDSIMETASFTTAAVKLAVKVYNTTAADRNEWVETNLPEGWKASETAVTSEKGIPVPSQILPAETGKPEKIIFKASVPSLGYHIYTFKKNKPGIFTGATVNKLQNGEYELETDLYKLVIDPEHGGVIKSLLAKKLDQKEFVDQRSDRKFNELRGNFYKKGGFHSSMEQPASVTVLENGPARICLAIEGTIAGNPFTQTLTLNQGQEKIDLRLKINWVGNEGIGEFDETNYQSATMHKAFYNDRYKLSALFALNLKNQKVYKNAPFDVLQSKLDNTFFSTWDSIKNNIILNWVDVTDGNGKYGMALLTDHTSSYSHGENDPLGLTLQYSGKGLWGRDYSIDGPSEFNYAIIPHRLTWDKAKVWEESLKYNEPLKLLMTAAPGSLAAAQRSFIKLSKPGYEVSSVQMDSGKLEIRIFNVAGDGKPVEVAVNCKADRAQLVELNGSKLEDLLLKQATNGTLLFNVAMPRFGIRTVKIQL